MGTNGPFTADAELPRSPSRRARGSTRHDVEHVSTNCRALDVREDRRDRISSTLSTNCRPSRRPREDRRFTLSSPIDELSCSCRPRGSTRDTISSSLSMNCRALGVGEDTRHDIEHDRDELSCTRRPRASTRHWRATCPTGNVPRRRDWHRLPETVFPLRLAPFLRRILDF